MFCPLELKFSLDAPLFRVYEERKRFELDAPFKKRKRWTLDAPLLSAYMGDLKNSPHTNPTKRTTPSVRLR